MVNRTRVIVNDITPQNRRKMINRGYLMLMCSINIPLQFRHILFMGILNVLHLGHSFIISLS